MPNLGITSLIRRLDFDQGLLPGVGFNPVDIYILGAAPNQRTPCSHEQL